MLLHEASMLAEEQFCVRYKQERLHLHVCMLRHWAYNVTKVALTVHIRMLNVHLMEWSVQAEGLLQILGGKEWLQQMVTKWGILLAAHGPYTAAGAALSHLVILFFITLGCIDKSFAGQFEKSTPRRT